MVPITNMRSSVLAAPAAAPPVIPVFAIGVMIVASVKYRTAETGRVSAAGIAIFAMTAAGVKMTVALTGRVSVAMIVTSAPMSGAAVNA